MKKEAIKMFESTVKYEGDHIFIKPFCDFFEINYRNQKRVVESHPLLKRCGTKKYSMLVFGDKRERLAVTKTGFITWILQLNANIVHPNLQEKLIEYQTLIFDWMFGSIQREQDIKLQYARLTKLKRLKSKINTEINRLEGIIKNFLHSRWSQGHIEFSDHKKLS